MEKYYQTDLALHPEFDHKLNQNISVGAFSKRDDVEYAVVSNYTHENYFFVVSLHSNMTNAKRRMREYIETVEREVRTLQQNPDWNNSKLWLGVYKTFHVKIVKVNPKAATLSR